MKKERRDQLKKWLMMHEKFHEWQLNTQIDLSDDSVNGFIHYRKIAKGKYLVFSTTKKETSKDMFDCSIWERKNENQLTDRELGTSTLLARDFNVERDFHLIVDYVTGKNPDYPVFRSSTPNKPQSS